MPSKVIGFRIEPEYENQLREIAKKMGVNVSDLVKRIVIDYLNANPDASNAVNEPLSPELQSLLNELETRINKFIELVNRERKKIDDHCKEHADEVVSRHPNEKWDYHYKWCIKRWYGILYNQALNYKRTHITPLISKLAPRINIRKYEEKANSVIDELLPVTGIILD